MIMSTQQNYRVYLKIIYPPQKKEKLKWQWTNPPFEDVYILLNMSDYPT